MKYIVWVKEGGKWEENGDGPLTEIQANRISREISKECGCKTRVLPVGVYPPEATASRESRIAKRVTVAREMTDLFPEVVVSLRQVMSFLKRQRTWFDFEFGSDKIWAGTREHGSFEDESAGEDDIREAKRLAQLLSREFGDTISTAIKLADDWTYLVVSTPKTAASRRKGSVDIARELVKVAREMVSVSTFPVGRGVAALTTEEVRVGDIGVLYPIASNVFHVSVPGRKYNYDIDKSYGAGGVAWVRIIKKSPSEDRVGSGWYATVVKVVAPYAKGEWKAGGPEQGVVDLDEEPREQEEPYLDKDGKPAPKGMPTGYLDMDRKPLSLGDAIELEHTTGRYGQTRTVRGILRGIDRFGGITLADPSSIRAWEAGKLNFLDQIKSEYIAMHWEGRVGYWEHADFEHGHKNYVKRL